MVVDCPGAELVDWSVVVVSTGVAVVELSLAGAVVVVAAGSVVNVGLVVGRGGRGGLAIGAKTGKYAVECHRAAGPSFGERRLGHH